ncbi:MAG: hypothetical protein F6K07_33395, partial [Okeania sp. SIO1H5]|nr:hypothetical protein [Okeania sp. SIO1H5]
MLSREKVNVSFPDLTEIQRTSFKKFLYEGLGEVLSFLPTITDPTNKLELEFFGQEYRLKFPRYSVRRAKSRDRTYSAQMYIPAKLTRTGLDLHDSHVSIGAEYVTNSQNKQKKYKKRMVFIGDLPLMTNRGTFVISGTERIIINQIVRSPGIYYKQELDKNNKQIYSASLISNRGSWLKFEIDSKDQVWVRIDKT